MADMVQVRFCGFGGQGIVLMGVILGHAAVREGLWVAGSNSYGAAARGSACRSEVVLSTRPVDFPHVLEADLLGAMSQEAYERFLPELKPEGIVVCDDPQVKPVGHNARRHIPIPATRRAMEELGNRQVANMVLLAATIALTQIVDPETLFKAVEETVATRFLEINRKALEMGFQMGEEARRSMPEGGVALGIQREVKQT
jgi:2-oxoglutarate ferredoxin oxidoreductase subunit gamma